jgi:diketogulonate reductase-like aldo/keto reductase
VLGDQGDNHVVRAAGAVIPKIGLGTWQLRGEDCAEIVAAALSLGYTHVDTAQGYANEEFVGEGLTASGVPRERVFITTKVRPDRMAEGDLQRSVDESLSKLGISEIDLLLLHWPNPEIPLAGTIRALNAVKRDGRARHIGFSNFTSRLLDKAWSLTEEPFAAEQIEYHPYLDQTTMLAALRRRGMAVIAYCPIALGKIVGDPDIEAVAKAHGRTAAQVTLRWLVQQPDVIAIPKTARPQRLKENLDVFDFALTGAEMAKLSALTRPGSRNVNEPQWVPEWD